MPSSQMRTQEAQQVSLGGQQGTVATRWEGRFTGADGVGMHAYTSTDLAKGRCLLVDGTADVVFAQGDAQRDARDAAADDGYLKGLRRGRVSHFG